MGVCTMNVPPPERCFDCLFVFVSQGVSLAHEKCIVVAFLPRRHFFVCGAVSCRDANGWIGLSRLPN
eukprot:scaffold10860_cov182-Amphora_coffeaeformis.AAC.25